MGPRLGCFQERRGLVVTRPHSTISGAVNSSLGSWQSRSHLIPARPKLPRTLALYAFAADAREGGMQMMLQQSSVECFTSHQKSTRPSKFWLKRPEDNLAKFSHATTAAHSVASFCATHTWRMKVGYDLVAMPSSKHRSGCGVLAHRP